jgi:hypothetical protein
MDAYDRANAPTPQKLRKGLSEPHDRSLLWFAYLAFDIIEAIVEGCPTASSRLGSCFYVWSDQRAAFGPNGHNCMLVANRCFPVSDK